MLKLLMINDPLKIFFSGIGGSGMSAIACFMADKGHKVAGSDRAFDKNLRHPALKILKAKGINIVKQDGGGIDKSFDFVLFSTAVEKDNLEYIKARALEIPIKTRPEYLSEIVQGFETIAVAGTSGKSTTSGLLAFLMKRLGLEPNFIGGGRVKQFRANSNLGNSVAGKSEHLVIEACESDGTIVNYMPYHSIILNLDLDHHPLEKTLEMFKAFINNTKDLVLINTDDLKLKENFSKGAATFSINEESDFKAEKISYRAFGSNFFVRGVPFSLDIPGQYNIYNALSCIVLLSSLEIPLEDIAKVLSEFKGIERRFDIHLNNGKHLVIDDYAHNPHKIASLMKAAKTIKDSICYIFQPHGFQPTKMMKNEYMETFAENLRHNDHLILLPIFYAGGTAPKDISSHDLAEGIRDRGGSVEVVEERKTILDKINKWNNYVVFGARDETLSNFAREIADLLVI